LAYEVLLGTLVGLIIVYIAVRSHFTGRMVTQAQRMAMQMFEQQKSQLETSFRGACEARLGEWKATELAQAIDNLLLDE
jgi:uncharacterized membrane-anchored protein YhcB (DUF1043 family)